MKKQLLILSLFTGFSSTFAQIVNIPDANFKACLVGNASVNTNLDTEIQLSEAQAFSGYLDCSGQNIVDLTGIEAFTAVTNLNLGNNQLTNLDVSQNSALVVLTCNSNQLTSVNLSQNTNLTWLELGGNQLTSLDVSQNTALDVFKCGANQLTNLDVSQNTALTNLICNSNQLTSLDVSQNTALTFISCHDNQITSLDVSQNASLTTLNCYINSLTSLNVANGDNGNFDYLKAHDNPDLSCIQVDDVDYSNSFWTGTNFTYDAVASFSENCSGGLGIDNLNSDTFLNIYPNPVQNILTIQTDETVKKVYVFNSLGNLVQTEEDNSFVIDQLESGVYFIQLETAQGYFNSMFIKD